MASFILEAEALFWSSIHKTSKGEPKLNYMTTVKQLFCLTNK